MKWKAKPYFDYSEWHDWFAWRPVRLDDENAYVWLVTVQRRYSKPFLEWVYVEKEKL